MVKVLFVDDEILAMEYLQNLIDWEQYGFRVVGHARSAKKALEIFEKEKPQVVISDIKMTGMDGLELAKCLKTKAPDTEVILLSAYQDFEYAKKGFEYGVSNYLLKHELCGEKLIVELEKVRNRIKTVEQKSRIYQKYFMEQLIFKPEDVQKEQEFGNRFFMIWVHKNECFSEGRFLSEEWNDMEKQTLEQVMGREEEGIVYLANTQLTGNNILFLYRIEKINSRYQIGTKIEQRCRQIASSLMAIGSDRFNILYCDEICKNQISAAFQKMSALIRYAVFWKNRCIYGIERLRISQEEECIVWNEHAENLRQMMQKREAEISDEVSYLFELVKLPENNLRALRELIYMLENLAREFENREGIVQEKMSQSVLKVDEICLYYIERMKNIYFVMQESQNSGYSQLVGKMIRYIRRNYHQELNLEQLGMAFHMNGVYMGQMFKKETGITFLKYLTNLRVEEAKKLLLEGKMNVSQVAEAVGYKTGQYFSQIFLKTTGVTPQEYRKWNGK